VFLKSFNGCSGTEVIAIQQINNQYRVNYFSKSSWKHKLLITNSLSEIESLVTEFFDKKGFIVQQGIRLIKINERKMDIRVLIQKDRLGEWKVISYFSRLAKKGLQVTNASSGAGEVFNLNEVYTTLTAKGICIPTIEEIEKFAVDIAYYLEKEFGKMGEQGIDIGIDDKGQIWFIESNPGPSHNFSPECTILGYVMFLIEKDYKQI